MFNRLCNEPGQRQTVATVKQDTDNADGGTAQGVGVCRSGRNQSNAETTADGVQFVSDRDQCPGVACRQGAPGLGWQIVLRNGVRYRFRFAVVQCVFPSHDPLDFREFTDHAGYEIGFTEEGGPGHGLTLRWCQLPGQCRCQCGEPLDLLKRGAELLLVYDLFE